MAPEDLDELAKKIAAELAAQNTGVCHCGVAIREHKEDHAWTKTKRASEAEFKKARWAVIGGSTILFVSWLGHTIISLVVNYVKVWLKSQG